MPIPLDSASEPTAIPKSVPEPTVAPTLPSELTPITARPSLAGPAAGAVPQPTLGRSYQGWLVIALLVAAVAGVYAPTYRNEFVMLDDIDYVVANPRVNVGLRAENAGWVLTHTCVSNWHPLTLVSHMLDCELYGLSANGHHISNVILHALAVVVMFLALRQLTGDLWPSAFVAAAFALHPLRVESVAWVAERKDVLSGLFFALTLYLYARYAHAPALSRYLMVCGALVLALMSKPTVVTTPCVLLLLDFWPLRRVRVPGGPSLRRLVSEKLPLLMLAAFAAAFTVVAQSTETHDGRSAVADWNSMPLGVRVSNALVSYVIYLGQTVYPSDLAVLYPHPHPTPGLTLTEVLGATVLLAVTTGVAVRQRRRRPALLIGWLWYLGMLIPAIGIIQVGWQGHADRYTYLPQIGLWVALAWGVPWTAIASRRVVAALVVAILLIWGWLSNRQLEYWRNTENLLRHSLACTGPNAVGSRWLGECLFVQQRWEEAAEQYRDALAFDFHNEKLHFQRGTALGHMGRSREALEEFSQAYQLNPDLKEVRSHLVIAHLNEGTREARAGNAIAALRHLDSALEFDPENPTARRYRAALLNQVGISAAQAGRTDRAVAAFKEAIRSDPTLVPAHVNLGIALMESGSFAEAAVSFRAALQIDPNDPTARAYLEQALKTRP
jgi:protein O-mannosyl-transferase